MPKLTVVKQNVDDLHERAGSQDVIHLHGRLHASRYVDFGLAYELPVSSQTSGRKSKRATSVPHLRWVRAAWRFVLREMLPEDAWSAGLAAAEECGMLLFLGTLGIVYPAAELLRAL